MVLNSKSLSNSDDREIEPESSIINYKDHFVPTQNVPIYIRTFKPLKMKGYDVTEMLKRLKVASKENITLPHAIPL